jgi:hypothetical protein
MTKNKFRRIQQFIMSSLNLNGQEECSCSNLESFSQQALNMCFYKLLVYLHSGHDIYGPIVAHCNLPTGCRVVDSHPYHALRIYQLCPLCQKEYSRLSNEMAALFAVDDNRGDRGSIDTRPKVSLNELREKMRVKKEKNKLAPLVFPSTSIKQYILQPSTTRLLTPH